ncbi:sensor histidine kinase [Agrobacterium vaccinii]|uniref:sensor histidine kinase n=1 Tax=Agrobacterium vaccinii TaxID=2735528 RepID=UPI001E43A5BA|nr:sensor histidine kinase [Agrobacterium vaccinii]UHS59764.1 sensor histidine kinase [Agrobacterium vaccinii]
MSRTGASLVNPEGYVPTTFFELAKIAASGRLGHIRWVECKGQMMKGVDGRSSRFSGTAIDITSLKEAEQQKHLLMEEMAHRVKNSFAVVQAIASQSLRNIDPAISSTFQNRITALGRAHGVLLQTSWEPTLLHTLLHGVLLAQTDTGRFDISGPEIAIGSKASLSLSLLIHEMATNAMKYGALSVDSGMVEVHWHMNDDTFVLEWREVGGPATAEPARKGFGSKLIGMGIDGSRNVEIVYGRSGLSARFQAPLSRLRES